MKQINFSLFGETVLISGRKYKAGELLTAYMNLNIERLDTLYSACEAQKNALRRFERSEEYSRILHRSMDTFDVVDKLLSKLTPYSRYEGENITLISIMEKSPLFRGFDVVSSDAENVERWRDECEKLGNMYLSAVDALRFCRDTAAPFLSQYAETESAEKAFAAINADRIDFVRAEESISFEEINGNKVLCKHISNAGFLVFVQQIFAAAAAGEVIPRMCGCCGKFFLPSNRLAKFCDRKAPGGSGKLCREIGARRRYEKKQKDNPISTAYTRVYKARYARMTNGKITKEEMSQWTEKAMALREKAFSENMAREEFEAMLKSL